MTLTMHSPLPDPALLEALAQLGRMLKEAPKNVGAKGVKPISGSKREPVMDTTPTLADLGLDKKTSS